MNRLRALLALVALALCLSSPSHSAKNFRVIEPSGGGQKAPHLWAPFTHWDLREMPACKVPWSWSLSPITPDLDGDGIANEDDDDNLFIQTAESAFNRWDDVTPSELGFDNIVSGSAPRGLKKDLWNTISFAPNVLGRTVNGGTKVWRDKDTGRITEADIVINSFPDSIPGLGFRRWVLKNHGDELEQDIDYPTRGNWPDPADGDTDWNGNNHMEFQVDLGKTTTHEAGHFLGLDHIAPLKGQSNNFVNPIMDQFNKSNYGPKGGGWTNLVLKEQDIDGENFLYCPDLGDAPDPWMGVDGQYPSKVHVSLGRTLNSIPLDAVGPGAEHILGIKTVQPRNWTYEWLAETSSGNVDSECEANIEDRDAYDDGVTWVPSPPVWGRKMIVYEYARYASDNAGNAHDYTNHPLYGNAWLDLNQDCVWTEGAEHFLHDNRQPSSPAGVNNVKLRILEGSVDLPRQPPDPSKPLWMRCRLDYGENSVATGVDGTLDLPAGAAQFGEVEDYKFYCTHRYESIWFCNPLPFPIPAFAMAVIGPSDPSDQTWSAVVTGADWPISTNPAPSMTYVSARDETIVEYPVPGYLPPNTYGHFTICRPVDPPKPPQIEPRMMMVTAGTPGTTPAALVPAALRVPSVNCAYRIFGASEPNVGKVLFTVGAVDFANGGWIDGPDSTHEWSDALAVTVAYRVTPAVIPIDHLNLCDPMYNQYPPHPVGPGTVTPEHAFEFLLDTPGDIPPGHHVILEVRSTWSTNATVSNQIIEFPDPIGTASGVGDTPLPSRLALDNHPNPFNPSTIIRYALPAPSLVTLAVFDVGGRLVRTLLRDVKKPAGVFDVEWNGTDSAGRPVASGVYFYRLTAGRETLTRKAVLLK